MYTTGLMEYLELAYAWLEALCSNLVEVGLVPRANLTMRCHVCLGCLPSVPITCLARVVLSAQPCTLTSSRKVMRAT